MSSNASARLRVCITLLLGAALGIGACAEAPSGPAAGNARLRVVNGSSSSVDLLLDGAVIVSKVGSASASTFVPVTAGSHQLDVRAGGQPEGDIEVSLERDKDYTMVVGGPSDALSTLMAADTASVPAAGKVKLRVIHGAPGAPALDIYFTEAGADLTGSVPLVTPFEYGLGTSDEFPGYVERDPGYWEVRFTERGTTNLVLTSGPIELLSGDVRTVVLSAGTGGSLQAAVVAE